MKKLLLLPLLLLTSCGNQDNNTNGLFKNAETRTFNKLHIMSLNKCISVKT